MRLGCRPASRGDQPILRCQPAVGVAILLEGVGGLCSLRSGPTERAYHRPDGNFRPLPNSRLVPLRISTPSGTSCHPRARYLARLEGSWAHLTNHPEITKGPRLGISPSRRPLVLVRERGVEPPRPFGHTDLNRARLPFRHSRASPHGDPEEISTAARVFTPPRVGALTPDAAAFSATQPTFRLPTYFRVITRKCVAVPDNVRRC